MSLIITHQGPAAEVFSAKLEVLKAEQQGKASSLVEASAMTITDAATLARANDLVTVMHATKKELEARAEYLKRPLLDTQRAMKSIIDGVLAPLEMAHKSLVGRVAAYNKKLFDDAAAEARRRNDEAIAAQRAKQKEMDDAHAANLAADQAIKDREAAEMEAILGKPVPVEKVVATPAPIAQIAPVAPIIAPVQASAVATRLVPELQIEETHPALAAFTVGGEVLVTVNRSAVKRVLDAGVVLPWAKIVMVEQAYTRRQA